VVEGAVRWVSFVAHAGNVCKVAQCRRQAQKMEGALPAKPALTEGETRREKLRVPQRRG